MWFVRSPAVGLWGKSVSQHLREVGKRQSFHLKWSWILVWRTDSGLSRYFILPFVSCSWVDSWTRRTFIKTILFPTLIRLQILSSRCQLVLNLNLSSLKGLVWNSCWFLKHMQTDFHFTVNLMFSLGMRVTGGGGRGCFQSSENKN